MSAPRFFRLLAASLVTAAVGVWAAAAPPPILFQHPTLNATQIVFAYAGSLWTVPRQGGEAVRLTAGSRVDSEPVLSPNGQWIAFTGDDQGNLDVYVMPAAGGQPRRLTWHPGPDEAVGWTPDSREVLFRSMRSSVDYYYRLYTVPLAGGMPVALPLPYANQGSYSPSGRRIAYVPFRNHPQREAWKHYRGGMIPRIRLAVLSTSATQGLPRDDSNNQDPMWVGGAIYFLSDRTADHHDNGHFRLYRYDLRTGQTRAVSPADGHDILFASAGDLAGRPAIVYTEMGKLFLLDVRSGRIRRSAVTLRGDFPAAQPHYAAVAHALANPAISPRGVRVAFQARGDILTVPVKYGTAQDITNTPGVMERYPAWSPDGRWIAYYSDAAGLYQLDIAPQDGIGKVRAIPLGTEPDFYYTPVWSPDSRHIAFSDITQNLWIADVANGQLTQVATSYYDHGGPGFDPAWSPDSRWLTYTNLLPNYLQAVYVYSLADRASHAITSGASDAGNSRFDASGKYLYFLASTNPNPGAVVIAMSSYARPTVASAYAVVLRKDLPSPLAPRPGLETPPAAPAAAPPAADPPAKKKTAAPPVVKIDFAGISQRIIALPIPPRNYTDLETAGAGVVFLTAGPVVPQARADHPGQDLYRFDLKTRKTKPVLSGIQDFVLDAAGNKMLIQRGQGWFVLPAAAPAVFHLHPGQGHLATADMHVEVVPRQEWAEMYRDLWREEAAYFYSPQMHGLSVPAAEKYYAQFLPGVESRSDLQYLFHDMLGNITVSHLFLSMPPPSGPKPVQTGLLGADYALVHGRYRFERIYSGENWNPGLHAPLTQPGVNVQVGDYLLAVNGRPLTAADNIYQWFQNTAGRQTVLTVGPDPDGAGERQVRVVPVASEYALRKLAWIHHNQEVVTRLSHGQLASVYLPDTAVGGYTNFNRYFYSQVGKAGAIIDERFNHGGYVANSIIDQLEQTPLDYISWRHGHIETTPAAIFGPKVMIANHFAGSGGDALPFMFKMEHIGTLVGTRTWGGLVGIFGYPRLMDGSMITAPSAAL
ncbi:MAG: S41 family peptidase, partial [Terriglobales bacterium]